MTIYCLASASGSPGVTTTVVGLATVWPRPCLVVEADPTGGSAILAGYFGGLVVPSGGLLDLVMAHRQNRLAEEIPERLIEIPETQAKLLSGSRSHAQAASLAPLWEPLLDCLHEISRAGTDVLIDAGRLGLAGWSEPLVLGSDLTVLVVRSGLPELSGARSWAGELGESTSATPTRLGLVVIGPGRPYTTSEAARALSLGLLDGIDWDPQGAAVFHDGADRPRNFSRSGYLRCLRALCEQLNAAVSRTRQPPAVERIRSIIQGRPRP